MITGSVVKRGPFRFAVVLELGRVRDPKTGLMRRKQQWVTFKPPKGVTAKQAEKLAESKKNEFVNAANRNEFMSPSKLTLVEVLRSWFAARRPGRPPIDLQHLPQRHRAARRERANRGAHDPTRGV